MNTNLLTASENALSELRKLHMLSQFGECEHPEECPAVLAIRELEQAIEEEKGRRTEAAPTQETAAPTEG